MSTTTFEFKDVEITNAFKFTDGNEALNKILTSDASGNVSWGDANDGIYAGSGTVPNGTIATMPSTDGLIFKGGTTVAADQTISCQNSTGAVTMKLTNQGGLQINNTNVNHSPLTLSSTGGADLTVTGFGTILRDKRGVDQTFNDGTLHTEVSTLGEHIYCNFLIDYFL